MVVGQDIDALLPGMRTRTPEPDSSTVLFLPLLVGGLDGVDGDDGRRHLARHRLEAVAESAEVGATGGQPSAVERTGETVRRRDVHRRHAAEKRHNSRGKNGIEDCVAW